MLRTFIVLSYDAAELNPSPPQRLSDALRVTPQSRGVDNEIYCSGVSLYLMSKLDILINMYFLDLLLNQHLYGKLTAPYPTTLVLWNIHEFGFAVFVPRRISNYLI